MSRRAALRVAARQDRQARELALPDERLEVRVRESARANTMRIIVGPRRPLEVIVPQGTPDTTIDRFLAAKRRWIETKVAVAREIASRRPTLGLDGQLWLGGNPLVLSVILTTAPPWTTRTTARRVGDSVRVESVAQSDDDANAKIASALDHWYRREARSTIESVLEREAARLGLEYASVAVRDQKTRWGSCSRKANLSFSWRLVLAPPEVLEYVVMHELLHLREPNHSKAFWRLLEAAQPGWQEQARWLRDNGQELHDYAAASAAAAPA